MLELKDFFHLPALDPLIDRLVAPAAGLTVVAGLDPRPELSEAAGVPPSGRMTLFRILARQILEQGGGEAVLVAADRDALRVSKSLQKRVTAIAAQTAAEYEAAIAEGAARAPVLLVVDHLDAATTSPVLRAAAQGRHVLSQLDTVLRGADVVHTLLELGSETADLAALRWVLAVQRLPALCPACRQPVTPTADEAAALGRAAATARYTVPLSGPFYRAAGCALCAGRGRQDTIAAFDLYCHADPGASFPLDTYASHLAAAGDISLDDLLALEAAQLRRAYRLFLASEGALHALNATTQARLAELEAAHRVAQQRTEALVTLQEMSVALTATTDLRALAHQICVQSCDLGGGQYAVLYLRRDGERAELLASHGWDLARVSPQVELATGEETPAAYLELPPGIAPLAPGLRPAYIRAGLYLPLVAQGVPVGALIVQAGTKKRFAPNERALLETVASQAAVALQRANLIQQLRQKVRDLEAAQKGLVQKERMEQELALARQVQQRMLPHAFPHVPGYEFAAHYRPARQVGGDFYDAFILDDDHFAVAIGDVSDKGMPAALYMALTRSLLRAEGSRVRSPRAVLARVNRLLLELGEADMFVTLFYGVIARRDRRLTYCRAGHDHPLLLRDGTVRELDGSGTVLGLLPGEQLRLAEETIALAPGDCLVLYSDGLSDVLSPAGEFFDKHRLIALIEAQAGQGATELCNAAFAALDAYQGEAEQHDDMALLAVAVDP